MSVTVYFANVSKKRNSTYQGTFTVSYDCTLKAPTSLDRPTFLVSAASMDYNAAKMGNRYYFIDDVVSVRNGQWEVSCILDVLATYKADILASTQYVTYSANSAKTWLADTRIPVLKSCVYDSATNTPAIFNQTGFFLLTVTGKNGCECFEVTRSDIDNLISKIQDWAIEDYDAIIDGDYDPLNPKTYSWNTTEQAIQSLSTILSQSGAIGNAYNNAPQMIRSCLWLPLDGSLMRYSNTAQRIFLGNYDTEVNGYPIKTTPYSSGINIPIPWKFNDWRRSVCETVYVYLPYAGLIQLGSDTLTGASEIRVDYGVSALDGSISYLLSVDGKVIGNYAGSCGANYAIGINQKAGLADIIQTAIEGVERTVAVAVDSSVSPVSAIAAAGGIALEGANTVYQVANTALTTHPSCVGSMGGAASAGVDQKLTVITVSHDTAVSPSGMAATMGRPTMEALALSGLTGFCQCANAHVAAAAQAREIDAIDFYLNSGFFIE